jgi:Mg2+-importing ATPase
VLVLFVIRTRRSLLKSRPSAAFTWTALGALAVGLLLPLTPLREALGFAPLGAGFVAFVAVVTAAYLALVETVKRRVMPRLLS